MQSKEIVNSERTLPGDYIAGFVDGEGSFPLTYRKDTHPKTHNRIYYYWKPMFMICLKLDDFEILERIKETLHCGTISKSKRFVIYQVADFSDLINKIIPFFETYPLRAKKRHDFELWKEALQILKKFRLITSKPF